MPATPAWPPHSLPRLFVDQTLARGALSVDGATATISAPCCASAPATGSSCSTTAPANGSPRSPRPARSGSRSTVGERLREREAVPDLWLLFAPIKRGRIDWLVEKATELGVARLRPGPHPPHDRRAAQPRPPARPRDRGRRAMRAHRACPSSPSRRSSTRCSRPGRPSATLYFADEARRRAASPPAPGPAAILIGPEGGFTDEERAAIRALPQARPVSLGPRILRADTAALAAVSLWMARGGRLVAHSSAGSVTSHRNPLAGRSAAARGRADDDPHRNRGKDEPPHREPRRSARHVRARARSRRSAGDRHRAREVRLSAAPTTARPPMTSPAASATCSPR